MAIYFQKSSVHFVQKLIVINIKWASFAYKQYYIVTNYGGIYAKVKV